MLGTQRVPAFGWNITEHLAWLVQVYSKFKDKLLPRSLRSFILVRQNRKSVWGAKEQIKLEKSNQQGGSLKHGSLSRS